jgi:oxygen-dependent protoporphyrinogen oxidase
VTPRRIAVIGGGITGLIAARELIREGATVTLIEASPQLGGKVASDVVDGTLIEHGPDSFLARDDDMVALCHELGLGDRLVSPAVFGAVVSVKDKLRQVPPGFPYGIPSSIRAALSAKILSPVGATRAALDYVWRRPLTGADISIGAFVENRFGRQVLDRLVDPLLAGTRAGDPHSISLAAAAPAIDAVARRYRSVMRGLHAGQRSGEFEPGPPPFVGLAGGMGTIVDRLEHDIRNAADVMVSTPARRVSRDERGRYRIDVGGGAAPTVDGVVITAPAFAAATLLSDLSPDAARDLSRIEYASVAVVTLTYAVGARDAVPGGTSGLLVGSSQGRIMSACTWFSIKWPHAAPSDRLVMRCFVGRRGRDVALELDDRDLATRVHRELSDILGLDRSPDDFHVVRWERGLPQYAVGHFDLVERIEHSLRGLPGVAVAGAAYRGSGLSDCISQAARAARAVIDSPTEKVGVHR